MFQTVSAVWSDRVNQELSVRFYLAGAGLAFAPFLLLPMLEDLLGLYPMAWYGDAVPAAVFGAALFGTIAPQMRVYRAAVGAETTETLTVRRLVLDMGRVGAVTTACFGPATAVLVVPSPVPGAVAGLAGFALLVAGCYVYPAALSLLATGRSVRESLTGAQLRQVLRAGVYARYWVAATSLATGSLLLFLVTMLAMFVGGAFVLAFLVVLFMPLFALPFFIAAPYVGAWVSTLAATGFVEATTPRPQP